MPAAKTKKPKKARGEPGATLLRIPVQWSNVNIGDETCRLGAKAERAALSPEVADENLCGKRLVVTIIARAGGGQADQESIPREMVEDALAELWEATGHGEKPLGCWCGSWQAGVSPAEPEFCHAIVLAKLLHERFGGTQ